MRVLLLARDMPLLCVVTCTVRGKAAEILPQKVYRDGCQDVVLLAPLLERTLDESNKDTNGRQRLAKSGETSDIPTARIYTAQELLLPLFRGLETGGSS